MAENRRVRVTHAPTTSLGPSMSAMPSEGPSDGPSLAPSVSLAPSGTPSISVEPSGAPSEYPTFNNIGLDEFLSLHSPRSTGFRVQHGIMFDVTAKDVDVTVHNFAIPFVRGGNCTVDVFSREGKFWYEKNNVPNAWTLAGSPDAYSPGVTLENPIPLKQRYAGYYG